MTTKAAEALYLSQHLAVWAGKGYAIYNPKDRAIADLPMIYGFNNGGREGWLAAVLLAEDGTYLGGHTCSHEGYMPSDLGVVEGSYPERHERFRAHYPDGYRMDFVPAAEVRSHAGLTAAHQLNRRQAGRTVGAA